MSAYPQTPQVRTLLLTDLVDSTTLVERLGEADRHTVRRAFADMARLSGAKPH